MKKRTAAFLIFAMLSFGQSAMAAKTYGYLVNEDFESGAGTLFNKTAGEIVYDDTLGIFNAFEIKNTVQTSPFEATNLFANSNSALSTSAEGPACYIETEFDVLIKGVQDTASRAEIKLTSSAAANIDTTSYAVILFDGTDNTIKLQYMILENNVYSVHYQNLAELKNNEWYRFKIVTHISDGSGGNAKRNSALYVNGENALPAPVRFTSESSNKIPYYDAIRVVIPASGKEPCTVTIDNLKVNKYNAAVPFGPLINMGALISDIRRADIMCIAAEVGDAPGEYSLSDYNNFYNEITKAVGVYFNDATTQTEVDNADAELKNAIKNFKPNIDNSDNMKGYIISAENGELIIMPRTEEAIAAIAVAAGYDSSGRMITADTKEFILNPNEEVKVAVDAQSSGNLSRIAYYVWDKDMATPLALPYKVDLK